jgi:hypothetical protein
MTDKSRADFFELTGKHINKTVIVRIDGREAARPMIREPVNLQSGGRLILDIMSIEEALALAERLEAGKATLEAEVPEN